MIPATASAWAGSVLPRPARAEQQRDRDRGGDDDDAHDRGDDGVGHAERLDVGAPQPGCGLAHLGEDHRRDGDQRGGGQVLRDLHHALTDVQQAERGGPQDHRDEPALGQVAQRRHDVDARDPDAEGHHVPELPGRQPGRGHPRGQAPGEHRDDPLGDDELRDERPDPAAGQRDGHRGGLREHGRDEALQRHGLEGHRAPQQGQRDGGQDGRHDRQDQGPQHRASSAAGRRPRAGAPRRPDRPRAPHPRSGRPRRRCSGSLVDSSDCSR